MALSNKGEAEALAHLKTMKLEPTILTHDVVTTVPAWADVLKAKECTAALAKNLFVKGKKGELGLVFAMADTKTDMKLVATTMAAAGGVRFADESVLNATLGVVQGAVTPLALVNDKEKKCQVIMDAAVMATEGPIAVHPCRNDQSVLMSAQEIKSYIESLDFKISVVDFAAAAAAAAPVAAAPTAGGKKQHADPNKKAEKKPQQEKKEKKKIEEGVTRLGMEEPKDGDFAVWYSQVITKAEMIEYYDVSGCYIIRPWAYEMWDHVKNFFDAEIKELGVENCYFPIFVSKDALEREKDHVEGFAPEVAWVTKAGSSDLEKPVALRPTSETVMYPVYAKWIRSHRDLPLRLNQWCNVIRWEFSHPTPFIRTREFLWQEGHSAFAKKEEADVEVRTILDLYRRVYEECLAVPCVPGVKTEKEKFAGGDYTTTVETYIAQVGRGCQGATSHALGQNFGKMFDINFEDPNSADGKKLIPWQNSWGITTRTIGVMTMVHGDDKGLVCPPRVAHVQVVIVPCGLSAKASEEEKDKLYTAASDLQKALKKGGIRARADLRDNYTPGWRYNYWELKGVPVRIELGPRELAEKKLVCVRRCDAQKVTLTWDESLLGEAKKLLDDVHDTMFNKAKAQRDANLIHVTEWDQFVPNLNNKCLLMAPWCGEMKCEDAVKKDSAEESKALLAEAEDDERAPSMGAKSLCIPFDQPKDDVTQYKCICKACTTKATKWVMFGRSY